VSQPPVPYGLPLPEPVLLTIGDISITQHWIYLPTGRHPVQGSIWTAADMSHTEEHIATVGVVLAVLFIWACLLSLLFLLMKERRTVGYIQVTVQGEGFHHSAMIPAHGPQALGYVMQQVNYARSLAAQPGLR
jgi:hypothetical protein